MRAKDTRYVAHFDMLGMSELVLRDVDQAWGALSDLAQAKEEILGLEIEVLSKKLKIRDRVWTFMFSDTVILFTLGEEPEDLYAVVVLCTELFSRSLQKCVPLRGGIAHGVFRFNLDWELFAGPSLVEAYNLGERTQWLGIVIDPIVAERATALSLEVTPGLSAIDEWKVPMKTGSRERRHVINWPAICQKSFTAPTPFTAEQFYQGFVPLFGPYSELPTSVKRKYENTVEYINSRL